MELTLGHWAYLVGMVVIIGTMAFRRNVVVPAVAATFAVTWAYTGNVIDGLESMFKASLVAASELFNIFLIIALITAMLGALQRLGSDKRMVQPFRKVMTGGSLAFWVLAAVTFVISLFFWPTPAVPLVGAILLPAAIRAGLPPLQAGVAIAIAGQGMALAADYVIQVAPDISATSAGIETADVADRGLVLSVVTGVVALVIAWYKARGSMLTPSPWLLQAWEQGHSLEKGSGEGVDPDHEGTFVDQAALARAADAISQDGTTPPDDPAGGGGAGRSGDPVPEVAGGGVVADGGPVLEVAAVAEGDTLVKEAVATEVDAALEEDLAAIVDGKRLDDRKVRISKVVAAVVPVAFLAVVAYMVVAKVSGSIDDVTGGDAAALVGGVAALLLLGTSLIAEGRQALEDVADHVVEGFTFAFKAMGVVLPIAGFFFIGNPDFAGGIMGLAEDQTPPALLFDLVERVYDVIPSVGILTAIGVLVVGAITGLDGSGFSGLPLTGSLSGAFAPEVGLDPATLAAIGQMGAIWVGGGTLVAWSSLVAVAGFARVSVVDLVRSCFVPVVAGLVVSTIVGVIVFG
jgi:hypothetical protein